MQRAALWGFAFVILFALMLSTLFSGPAASPGQNRGAVYQVAPAIPANLRDVLASFGNESSPQQLARLNEQLGASSSAINASPNLISQYLATITKASSQLAEIKTLLQKANASLATGDISSVSNDIQILRRLSTDTSSLLNSSAVFLNQISTTYSINTTIQTTRVKQMYGTLQADLLQINDLRLATSLKRVESTLLFLNSSATNVLVGENFTATGFLKWKEIPLKEKVITVSWEFNNESVLTNSTGEFDIQLSFPFGTPTGSSVIEATFQPVGNDTLTYQIAYAAIEVSVNYEPTQIHAKLTKSTLKPTEEALIYGNLTTSSGVTLRGESISISLNDAPAGYTNTLGNGAFYFILTVPESLRNGTYTTSLSFTPYTGMYAPSSYDLQLNVITIPSRIDLKANTNFSFSGTNVTLAGNASYPNETRIGNGAVSIYFDNVFYGNTTLQNGVVAYTLKLPILANFGYHVITVRFTPSDPSTDESQTTTLVYVVNTPITILTAATLITASAVIGVSLDRRRIHLKVPSPPKAIVTAEPLTIVKPRPILPEMKSYEETLSGILRVNDNGLRVRMAYALAKRYIDTGLRETPRDNETTREYFRRVTSQVPEIGNVLRQLSELYELADYSQFSITRAQSKSALEKLELIRKETAR